MSNPTNQQQQAIDATGAVLLTAGAGTGKTATLVKRCVQLVTEKGVSVDELLVVTFTNAAATEMRLRLREALQEKLSAKPDDERLRQQLLLLEGAHISTIHSFCLELIRSHFTELGLDPGVSVLEDSVSRPLANEIVRQVVVAEITRNPAVGRLAEQYFGGDGERLAEQIRKAHDFYAKQVDAAKSLEGHIGFLAEPEAKRWQAKRNSIITGWLLDWQMAVAWQTPKTIAELEEKVAAGKKSKIEGDIRNILARLPQLAEAISALTTEPDDNACIAILKHAFELSGKNFWVSGTGTSRGLLEKFFEEAAELAGWLPDESTDPLVEEWNLAREPMRTLLELTRAFGAQFAAAKRASGGVDFSDLEQLALQVLAGDQVAEQWRQRFKHVFVDECQDINAAQNALIQALSYHDENANLFMVGDVKQSIYRFRMAEPKLFRDYAKEWTDKKHHQVLPLNENFRSREGIIAFANDLFGCLMGAGLGGVEYDEAARLRFGLAETGTRAHLSLQPPEEKRPQNHWNDPDCRVELHLVDSKAEADEGGAGENANAAEESTGGWGDLLDMDKQAGVTAKRLQELMKGGHQVWDKREGQGGGFRNMKWSDVGILMRSVAGRTGAFRREFLRRGIPLVAEQGDFLATLEAQDLTALLRVLDNPQQDIPLFAVLRSPLVGFSLDELVALRPKDKKTAWHRMAAAKENERASRFIKKITQWRRLALMTSLSSVLETVLAETRYEAFLHTLEDGADRVANVRRYLDLARRYDPLQRQGMHRFLKFIDEQQEEEQEISPLPPRQPEAVQLISIHKSKGLEFPIVVVAGIGSRFNQTDLNEGILFSRGWGIAPQVVDLENRCRQDSLIRWQVRREEKQESIAEELRLLYVAITRARDTLLLVGNFNPKSESWAKKIARPPEISIPRAMSYCEWICMWLGGPADWAGEEGDGAPMVRKKSPHLRCYIHSDSGEIDKSAAGESAGVNEKKPCKLTEPQLQAFTWTYPHESATCAAAKTSASALRRMANVKDDDTSPLAAALPAFQKQQPLSDDRLTAAQKGSAHHCFLEHLDPARASDMSQLRSELERIRNLGWISEAEAKAIDLNAILKFWQSDLGAEIIKNKDCMRPELNFTAGFTPKEMADITGKYALMEGEELIILQGAVDLAVILPEEIWIVDFKTDQVTPEQLPEKARTYEVQLRLYAAALGKIYNRKTTKASLYFLKLGEAAKII